MILQRWEFSERSSGLNQVLEGRGVRWMASQVGETAGIQAGRRKMTRSTQKLGGGQCTEVWSGRIYTQQLPDDAFSQY